MHDAEGVEVGHRGHDLHSRVIFLLIKEFITITDDLCKNQSGLGLRQPRALLYEVEERDAGAALHHEEVVVRVLEHGHAPAVADQSEAGIVVT